MSTPVSVQSNVYQSSTSVEASFRSVECVSMFNKCRSFFYVRLSTHTSSECTRVTRFKSEVQDSYPEKGRVSTEKSMSRQKKIVSSPNSHHSWDQKSLIGSQENHRIFTGKTKDISLFSCDFPVNFL